MQGHKESHHGPHHHEHKHENKHENKHHNHEEEVRGEANVDQEEMSQRHHHKSFISFITHPFAHPVVTILAIIAAFAAFKFAGLHPGFLLHQAFIHFHDSSYPMMFMDQVHQVLELAAPSGPHF